MCWKKLEILVSLNLPVEFAECTSSSRGQAWTLSSCLTASKFPPERGS